MRGRAPRSPRPRPQPLLLTDTVAGAAFSRNGRSPPGGDRWRPCMAPLHFVVTTPVAVASRPSPRRFRAWTPGSKCGGCARSHVPRVTTPEPQCPQDRSGIRQRLRLAAGRQTSRPRRTGSCRGSGRRPAKSSRLPLATDLGGHTNSCRPSAQSASGVGWERGRLSCPRCRQLEQTSHRGRSCRSRGWDWG
jgi:hypothetical protein